MEPSSVDNDLQSFLHRVIALLPVPALIVDTDLTLVTASAVYRSRFNVPGDLSEGTGTLRDLLEWQDPALRPFIDALAAGQEPSPVTLQTPGNMLVAMQARRIAGEAQVRGLPPFILLYSGEGMQDVGELTARLYERAQLLFFVFEAASRRFVMRTPLFGKFADQQAPVFTGDTDLFLQAVHPADRADVQILLGQLELGRPGSIEYRILINGDQHWWKMHLVPQREGGELRLLAGLVEDITAQKEREIIQRELEQERTRMEREQAVLREKSAFLGLVSHEFRTPLSVIQTSTEMLNRYLPRMNEAQRDEHFSRIERQVFRMTAMLDEILLIGRIGTESFEKNARRVFIEPFCRELLQRLRDETGGTHSLRFSSQGVAPALMIDPHYMEQAMRRILDNARAYSEPGTDIHCFVSSSPTRVRIRVQDSGMGIPEADLPNVFEFFYRGANVMHLEGTGLGLALARQVVDLHNGEIGIESTEGAGTTVTITLPVVNLVDPR